SRRRLTRAPRGRTLAAVGAATAAAAVAAAFVLVGQGNQTRGLGQRPASSSGGPSIPRRAGAGAAGAVPVGAPTTVVRSLPRVTASASASELLFDKIIAPLPARGHGNPPLSPPRLPARQLPRPVPSTAQSQALPSASGTIAVSPGSLSLGSSSQGVLTISAEGAAQTWSASTTSGQVALGSSGGVLQPGQSIAVPVSIDRANGQGGSAVIYVDQGSSSAQTVQVSWAATPAATGHQHPRPTHSPSPSPSSSQSSPSPSPSPSNSSGSSPPSSPATSPSAQSPTPAPSPSRTSRPHPRPRPTPSPRPSDPATDSSTQAPGTHRPGVR
ncbi:MAG TPA: hypothetical protein VGG16_09330, partial [Streptosporangiaceae bacterium]